MAKAAPSRNADVEYVTHLESSPEGRVSAISEDEDEIKALALQGEVELFGRKCDVRAFFRDGGPGIASSAMT